MRPFGGGDETPIPVSGTVLGTGWADSTSLCLASRTAHDVWLVLQDLRTGAQRDVLQLPDSTLSDEDPTPDGWEWIPASMDRIVVHQAGKTLEIRKPAWYGVPLGLAADPTGRRAAFRGFDAAFDSVGIGMLTLARDSVAQWASLRAENATVTMLADGADFIAAHQMQSSQALYTLSGPGQLKSLGTLPRPLVGMSVSGDLRRATAVERNYVADAWMYDVTRY